MTESIVGDRPRRASRFANYRWIPWAIVACFVVVFAVNGGLIYFAAESWPGLTTDHAYNEGLAYNRVIDQAAKEARLGWKAEVAYMSTRTLPGGRLAVDIRDADGAALDDLKLEGEMVRPVGNLPNVALIFTNHGEGSYAATIAPPLPGQWVIYLTARRGETLWHGGKRIMVPQR